MLNFYNGTFSFTFDKAHELIQMAVIHGNHLSFQKLREK